MASGRPRKVAPCFPARPEAASPAGEAGGGGLGGPPAPPPGLAPGRALHELAERESAALLVLGSSHRSAVGRVLAGTTAERLLHGSPCPVAVAPRGFATSEAHGFATIGVAYDGSE